MRIAISTSVIQRGKGGLAQYVFSLVKALMLHSGQHDFHLLVLEEDVPLFKFAEGKFDIVPINELYRPPVNDIAWHQSMLPAWLNKHKIDVVHIPSYRRMLFSAPCALVTTIHDLAQFHVAHKYDWVRMFYGKTIARQLAVRQDDIVAISQFTARDVESLFHVSLDRIHVIYNGFDQDRFRLGDPLRARNDVAKRWNLTRPFLL